MRIFADTSGFFALLVKNDAMHIRSQQNFAYFASQRAKLLTSSFVLIETVALLQRRAGLGAVHDFQLKIFPLLDIIWINGELYTQAIQRLFALNHRSVSLVDCLSFEIMESREIEYAFSFDKYFQEYGFTLTAFHDSDV